MKQCDLYPLIKGKMSLKIMNETMLVLKDCDFDLEKVEAKMRELTPSRGTSIRDMMKPYMAMMEKMGSQQESDVWEDVRRKLK